MFQNKITSCFHFFPPSHPLSSCKDFCKGRKIHLLLAFCKMRVSAFFETSKMSLFAWTNKVRCCDTQTDNKDLFICYGSIWMTSNFFFCKCFLTADVDEIYGYYLNYPHKVFHACVFFRDSSMILLWSLSEQNYKTGEKFAMIFFFNICHFS